MTPPPFVPFFNAVQANLVYLMGGQRMENTFTFQLETQPTVAQMTDLATALHTFYTNHLKSSLTSAIALSEIVIVGLWAQNAPGYTLVISPVEPGTASGVPAPYNVAYCASLKTNLRGRNYRGRKYVPGLPGTVFGSASNIDAAVAAAINAALAWLLTPANIADFIWCIASRWLNKSPRATGVLTGVTAVSGDLTSDSQRRRLPGRGA